MTASKIYLKGVRAYGYVGLLPEENVLGQWFEVDAVLWVDFEKATHTDAIADTLDYRSCLTKIETLIQTSKFALIERLAGAIADSLLDDPQIEQVQIRITKRPPIPNFQGSVAVEIVRTQPGKSETTAETEPKTKRTKPAKQSPAVADLITDLSELTGNTEQSNAQIVSLHTDGACSKNPGPGGWAVVVHFADGSVKEFGGGVADTTNNQMEMQAAIAALEFLAQHEAASSVPLYTDSRYTIDGITKWIKGWKKNGWQTKDKKPIKNQELWQALDRLNSSNVRWLWVEGHAGDPDNERCDAIARSYAARYATPDKFS